MITSIHDLLNAQGHFPRQRFVEYFSGKQISAIWNERSAVGTPEFAMIDAINGGYKITCATTTNEYGAIGFNQIRPFSNTSSVVIGTTSSDATTSRMVMSGLSGVMTNQNTEIVRMGLHTNESTSFFVIDTADASTRTATDSTVAVGTSWNEHKGDLKSSSVDYTIDGTFQVTKTTNLPTVRLQPTFLCQRQGADMEGSIRYLECYNK